MRTSAQFLATLAFVVLPTVASAQAPTNLTRAMQTTNAEERFKRMDTSGDGRFDRAEYLKARNQAEQQAEARIRQMLAQEFGQLDGNKDGSLTAAEIDAKVKIADAGKKSVARLDKNKDGKISTVEYTAQASGLEPAADADQQIRQWDGNGDKIVTRQEFVAAVLRQFDSFDANRDGTVTPQEAEARLKAATQPQGR